VDTEKFRRIAGAERVVRERFAIPDSRRIVVYMGHLHERKGVHVLLQAAEIAVGLPGGEHTHYLFLGNRGGEEREFARYYSRAASHITFGGYQSDVAELLQGCYVGCIPSTGWDSFPMSSLEMQACGVPVLVSDWQGVPETIANGETGIVVPVGNARRLAEEIIALAADPARRERLSVGAQRRIEDRFTREHQIENLTNCLRAMLE
jgi:glycosyltransferase involved in cell wall biosynthesis